MNPHFHLRPEENLANAELFSLCWVKDPSLWGNSTIYSEFSLFKWLFFLWTVTGALQGWWRWRYGLLEACPGIWIRLLPAGQSSGLIALS